MFVTPPEQNTHYLAASSVRTGVVTATAIGNVSNPLDTAWHQRFSGVAQATRAVAAYRGELDPDGCLVRFGSQPAERENGRDWSLHEGRWHALLHSVDAIILRRFDFVLDSGRLNQSGRSPGFAGVAVAV
jgi:hypothetical protein